jgi:regulatory protein
LTGFRATRGSGSLPGSRARPGEGEGRRGPRGTPRDRALRLLAVRDRSRRELERRLLQIGFEPEEVTDALDGLEGVGLIDDERFAQAVVEHETSNRLSGRRAVMSKLMASGVDRATAERSLEDAGADPARADELAVRRATRLARLAPEVAHRRLVAFLVRRGHSPRVSAIAAARALRLQSRESGL